MTRKYKLFTWLSLPALALTTACSDEANINGGEGPVNSDLQTVTLVLDTEKQTLVTRADSDPLSHISDGSKANKLVFAVYTDNEDGTYTIEKEFGTDATTGQKTILVDQYPVTVQFLIDRSAKYTVAFWAQSNETGAFDTDNLEKVKVNYSNVKNNDELRDAFCETVEIRGTMTTGVSVELRRPLAQINVGTTGWDYEGAAILRPNPRTYSQSEVTLSGMAQYYNVLAKRTLTQSELAPGESAVVDSDVTFSLNLIPAFYNLSDTELGSPSAFPYSAVYGPKDTDGNPVYDEEIEEFLKLKWGNESDFLPYIGWSTYNNPDQDYKLQDTGTFKYLSMCYVLPVVAFDSDGNVTAANISSFKFSCSDDDAANQKEFFTISNVPVQKNWRTNIVTDNMFLVDVDYHIYIVPTYCGDYNNLSGNLEGDSKDDWNLQHGMAEDQNGFWFVKPGDNGDPNPDWGGYNDNYQGTYTPGQGS